MHAPADAPIWLSDADLRSLLDPLALMEALRGGFAAVDAGEIVEPPSATMAGLDGGTAYLTTFPAHHRGTGLASVKLLSGRPGNAADGSPEIDAVLALADPNTGRIVALMAARALTALRTAAVTTLAMGALTGDEPLAVGLVGTGAQAMAHARMLGAAGLAARFLVAAPRQGLDQARRFASAVERATSVYTQAWDTETIAAEADAIVTMTLARRPLPLGPLRDLRVLCCIGPFLPDAHEIEPRLAGEAALVVSDHPDRLRKQWSGSPLLDMERASPVSLARVLAESAPAGRGLRLFLSDGRGFEDNIAGTLAFDAARRLNRGLRLP